jgi:hypothetical protein
MPFLKTIFDREPIFMLRQHPAASFLVPGKSAG